MQVTYQCITFYNMRKVRIDSLPKAQYDPPASALEFWKQAQDRRKKEILESGKKLKGLPGNPFSQEEADAIKAAEEKARADAHWKQWEETAYGRVEPTMGPIDAAIGLVASIPAMATTLGTELLGTGVTLGNIVNPLFEAYGTYNFANPESDFRQALSRYNQGEGDWRDVAFEGGLNALNFLGARSLPGDIEAFGKGYQNIATGNSMIPYAWRSPAVGLSQEASADMFSSLLNSGKLTPTERNLILEYQYNSNPFTGRFGNLIDAPKRDALNTIINKYQLQFPQNSDVIATRRFNFDRGNLGAKIENGRINFGDRPTSFSAGVGNPNYGGAPDRLVIPSRYLPKMKNNFVANEYNVIPKEDLELIGQPSLTSREKLIDFGLGIGTTNKNVAEERELIGTGLDFKQIGKVKNDIGGFDYIVKPRNATEGANIAFTPDELFSGITLERSAPKPKSKILKKITHIVDPSFKIRKSFRDDMTNPKTIRVDGETGYLQANKAADGTYYFNAVMTSPFESGKAMLKMDELLPPKPTILEPNSLSLDSYLNTIKLGKRPHWNTQFENYIPLNHSAIHNTMLSDKFGIVPDGYTMVFNSLEEANAALKDVNTWLKKQGITHEADVIGNGNGLFGIKIPNFRLTRDYKMGGYLPKAQDGNPPSLFKYTEDNDDISMPWWDASKGNVGQGSSKQNEVSNIEKIIQDQLRKDIRKAPRSEQIRYAVNQLKYMDPNYSPNLETLMNMTAWMENDYGTNPDAYGRDYTNSFMSLDDPAIDAIYIPRGQNTYNRSQRNVLDNLKKYGYADRDALVKALRAEDPIAAMLAARATYYLSPDPLPDMSNPEAVFKYFAKNYNHYGYRKHKSDEEAYAKFLKGWEKYGKKSSTSKSKMVNGGDISIPDLRRVKIKSLPKNWKSQ